MEAIMVFGLFTATLVVLIMVGFVVHDKWEEHHHHKN